MTKRQKLKGCDILPSGAIRARVKVNGVSLPPRTFPAGTDPDEIAQWRLAQKIAHKHARPRPTVVVPGSKARPGSFAADVEAYLQRIAAKTTVGQKRDHLAVWLDALGRDRRRSSITADEIDRITQRWEITPVIRTRGRSCPKGLSHGTIKKRLTSLQSLWSKLDGKHAPCPVKLATRYKDPAPAERSLDYGTIERMLAAMPRELSTKKGSPPRPARAYYVACIEAYTGLEAAQIRLLEPSDLRRLDEATPQLYVGRGKGAGVADQWIALTTKGRDAVRAYAERFPLPSDFNENPINRSIKRAGVRAGLPWGSFSQKWLRHSFGTHAYATTGDERTVARLMVHAEGSKMTSRYTKAAHAEVDARAVAAMTFGAPPAAGSQAPRLVKRRARDTAPVSRDTAAIR